MSAQPPAVADASTFSRLFVYGTLVDPRCLDEVLGHRHVGERLRAQLVGYQRRAEAGYPYPFIVAADHGVVDGVLILDLSPQDMRTLDRYEDVEDGVYQREVVEVEAWGCGPGTPVFQAYTYVAGPALAGVAQPR